MLNESTQPALPHMEGPGKAAEPKRKERVRRAYHRKPAPVPQLAFRRHLKIVNDDGDADPCNSGPGLCLVLECPTRDNLIADITPSASFHIPRVPGIARALTLPVRRSNKRNITEADIDQASDQVLWRAEYLLELVGSTCRRDVPGPLSQKQVAKIQCVEAQAIQQIEYRVKSNAKLAALARESFEQQSMRGEIVWPDRVEKLRPPRAPLVQIRSRRPKEQP